MFKSGERDDGEEVDDNLLVLGEIGPFSCLKLPKGAVVTPSRAAVVCSNLDSLSDGDWTEESDSGTGIRKLSLTEDETVASSAAKSVDSRVNIMIDTLAQERHMASAVQKSLKSMKRNRYPSSRKKPSLVMGSPSPKMPRKKKKVCKQGRRSYAQYQAYLRRLVGDEAAKSTLKHIPNPSNDFQTPVRPSKPISSCDSSTPPVLMSRATPLSRASQIHSVSASKDSNVISSDHGSTPEKLMLPRRKEAMPSSAPSIDAHGSVKKQVRKMKVCY